MGIMQPHGEGRKVIDIHNMKSMGGTWGKTRESASRECVRDVVLNELRVVAGEDVNLQEEKEMSGGKVSAVQGTTRLLNSGRGEHLDRVVEHGHITKRHKTLRKDQEGQQRTGGITPLECAQRERWIRRTHPRHLERDGRVAARKGVGHYQRLIDDHLHHQCQHKNSRRSMEVMRDKGRSERRPSQCRQGRVPLGERRVCRPSLWRHRTAKRGEMGKIGTKLRDALAARCAEFCPNCLGDTQCSRNEVVASLVGRS